MITNNITDQSSQLNQSRIHITRKQIRLAHQCPICKQKVKFKVEQKIIDEVEKFPFTHIVLHGVPVHAMIAYIDKNLIVRGIETSKSLEISRDGGTFGQILRKWSNPL